MCMQRPLPPCPTCFACPNIVLAQSHLHCRRSQGRLLNMPIGVATLCARPTGPSCLIVKLVQDLHHTTGNVSKGLRFQACADAGQPGAGLTRGQLGYDLHPYRGKQCADSSAGAPSPSLWPSGSSQQAPGQDATGPAQAPAGRLPSCPRCITCIASAMYGRCYGAGWTQQPPQVGGDFASCLARQPAMKSAKAARRPGMRKLEWPAALTWQCHTVYSHSMAAGLASICCKSSRECTAPDITLGKLPDFIV